jgi:diguanylate cyclase (GGDEF)-like protein/PAS domain S-box-containing protein
MHHERIFDNIDKKVREAYIRASLKGIEVSIDEYNFHMKAGKLDKIKRFDIGSFGYLNVSYEDNEIIKYLLEKLCLEIEEMLASKLENKQEVNQYQRLIENHVSPMIIIDPKSLEIVEANKAALSFYEYTKDEILSKTLCDISLSSKSLIVRNVESITNNVQHSFITKHINKSGEEHDVEIHGALIEIEDKTYIYSIIHDISEQRRITKELQEKTLLFDQLFTNTNDGIALIDKDGYLIRGNKRFFNLFYLTEDDVKDKRVRELIVPDESKDNLNKVASTLRSHNEIETVTVRQTKYGERLHIDIHGFPVILADNSEAFFIIYTDITREKIEQEKIKFLSYKDELTGLFNRRYFNEALDRMERENVMPVSIIVGDADGLKEINDSLGHKAGDRYLVQIANNLQKALRDEDIIARLGGDEFGIILKNVDNDNAKKLKQRIIDTIKEANADIKISLGLSTKNNEDETLEKVFNQADKEMYMNKGSVFKK